MPPPGIIPDSDASSTLSSPPTTSPNPQTLPPPATAAPESRKRSASLSPDEPVAQPTVFNTEAVGAAESAIVDATKESIPLAPEEPLSEEAKEEERREKQIEAIKARNKQLSDEVEAMEAQLADVRGKL
ncbi:hypothetical protein O988_09551, partial [Pseudogymnoascus sp. VKM F-3808]